MRYGESRFLTIWKNFKRSFEYFNEQKNFLLKGEDYLGNKYYEIEAKPSVGRRNPSRWFEVKGGNSEDALLAEVPPEWEAWLRRKRINPPTDEEVARNMELGKRKKEYAAKKEAERQQSEYSSTFEQEASTSNNNFASRASSSFTSKVNKPKTSGGYPMFDEYESSPGSTPGSKN